MRCHISSFECGECHDSNIELLHNLLSKYIGSNNEASGTSLIRTQFKNCLQRNSSEDWNEFRKCALLGLYNANNSQTGRHIIAIFYNIYVHIVYSYITYHTYLLFYGLTAFCYPYAFHTIWHIMI